MNKATLIELMAKDTKLPKASCKNALESFIKAVETSLKKNKSVVLTGFGTFSVMKRKARVRAGDLLIIKPWDIQNEKSDIVYRYTRTQSIILSKRRLIPPEIDVF